MIFEKVLIVENVMTIGRWVSACSAGSATALDRKQCIIRHEPHSPYVFLYTYVVGSTFMYSFSAYTFKQGAKRRLQLSNNSKRTVNNNVLLTGELDIRINKCGYIQFMNVPPRRQKRFRWSGYVDCSLDLLYHSL